MRELQFKVAKRILFRLESSEVSDVPLAIGILTDIGLEDDVEDIVINVAEKRIDAIEALAQLGFKFHVDHAKHTLTLDE